MGKDKAKNARSKGANSWEASANNASFLGFSAFTSTLSSATDPEYQLDSDYQVQFKKLLKKDAVSRMKALEELNSLFGKIDLETDSSASIRALLSAWELTYRKLVNDDDRKVREMSSLCLGTLGTKVGKNLGPHVKHLFGPWLFSICDQKDQSYNTALQSFNTIFPEKKRSDVFRFAHDTALQYLTENLQETTGTLGDGKSVPPEVLQDRYDRCISNSLLAIEYLIENSTSMSTSADDQSSSSSSSSTTTTTQSINQDIYQETLEKQFFSFLSSKSAYIRKTCYRLITTIINRVPNFSDNNLKDFSTKILGLFSEKDPSTHLFMWDAIISFLKKYKEKAWEGVDARKHVLPRFWAFLRTACYGSYEISYPMVLPFLSFIPNSVVGDSVAFFEEFFGNTLKGLEILENIKQFGSSERATTYLLTSVLECIVFCSKKWSTNQAIVKYLVSNLFGSILLGYFMKEYSPYSHQLTKNVCETMQRLVAAQNDLVASALDDVVQRLYTHTTNALLELEPINDDTTATQDAAANPDPRQQAITINTLFARYRLLFEHKSTTPALFQQLSKQLFQFCCQHFNLSNAILQDRMFEMIGVLLSHFNIRALLEPEIKDTKQFVEDSLLPNIKLALNQSNSKSIYNLFNIFTVIANGNDLVDFQSVWSKLVDMLKDEQNNVYLVNLISQLKCDRSSLACASLNTIVNTHLHSEHKHDNQLFQLHSINQTKHSLMSVLIVSPVDGSYSPLIDTSSIIAIINWVTNELKDIVLAIVLNGGEMEFSAANLIYASRFILYDLHSTVELNPAKIALWQEIAKSAIHLHHQTSIDTSVYTNQLRKTICSDTNTLQLHNHSTTTILLPIIFDNLHGLRAPDTQFLATLTLDVIGTNDLAASLAQLYQHYSLSATKYTMALDISWLQTDMSPFRPQRHSVPLATQEQYFRLHLYLFEIMGKLMKRDGSESDPITAILKSTNSDKLIIQVLTGLLSIGCNNPISPTLHKLQSMQQLKQDVLLAMVNRSVSTDDQSISQASWMKILLASDNTLAVGVQDNNQLLLKNILSVMAEATLTTARIAFIALIQQQHLNNSYDTVVQSHHNLNLFQLILPSLVEQRSPFVEQVRTALFKDLEAIQSSMPNALDPICFKISLLCSIATYDDEHPLNEHEGHILLKLLQMIQQWHLRARSALMKDQAIELDVMEIPLSQLFIVASQFVVAKSLFLSTNQSQLIQTLLNQWISEKDAQDPTLLKRYNSLKLFNIILSKADNQRFILPNTSEEYLIETSSLLVGQWIAGRALISNLAYVALYDLYSTTLAKIPVATQFRIAQLNLKQLYELVQCEHPNIQRTAYNLLASYFTNESVELVKAFELDEDTTEYIISDELAAILTQFELWKQLKADKQDQHLMSKVVGTLMVWDLVLRNYAMQDFTKKAPINGYLNDKRKVSTLLTCIFPLTKKDDYHSAPHVDYDELPRVDTEITYANVQHCCAYMIYVLVNNLPSMARCWWSDDCSSKISQQVDAYITHYISPLIIKNEIQLVNAHKEPAGSNFSIKASSTIKEVTANYEKDEMTISLSLQIPDAYPLRVLQVEFSKRIGVTEMQWRKWLLSMTSLLLTQDGSILDVCLLWKSSLDKHFQGVDLCPICYSLFFNGTIPKFQCKTCKNKFHAGCIYKWFSTSHKSTCPLCQTELQ
ncbi:hypothetical protein SAMD00019534_102520 [Acytostelium subglobosum LB1]|uniref:hypothetical protein n=1 Tax=Acytostelium subglobosum LB1 TaxID=1410327 RepID=UPI0006448395|nr:hypothetical protein SAMD00019534_102520 [Acytostelium subglobosum LB1]GAM27077.1 hypothetical protein SAMD00019534_102520 [Acytostelium subglobosum LB1]|eukprot:XP_012749957.1 hypothetical protein SAMD00019534_102520 [Acytostelium subglobosum LB1]